MRTGFLIALGIIIGSTLSTMIAIAWTAPTASPPGNNVSSPINTGATSQLKNGTLGVNGLGVFGNTILNGTNGDGIGNGVNSYLNFGATAGQNGYGVRDNNGTLEFKNTSGSWGSLNATLVNLLTVNGITTDGLGNVTGIKFPNGTQTASSTGQATGSSYVTIYGYSSGSNPSTLYAGFNMVSNSLSEDSTILAVMPQSGVAQSMYLITSQYAQPASGNIVVTVRKNGVSTPLSVTIPAGSPIGYIGSDTVHTVSYSAGDKLDVMYTINNANLTSSAAFHAFLKI